VSNKWLKNADLFAKTEGFLTAIQDQVILTGNKIQEVYIVAAKHRRDVQKMWKRTGDDPAHYCSMTTTSTYRVCKKT
jgi:hypothetical protein